MGLFGSFSGSPFLGIHGLYLTRDWGHCWYIVYSNKWLGFHVFEAGKKEKAVWHIICSVGCCLKSVAILADKLKDIIIITACMIGPSATLKGVVAESVAITIFEKMSPDKDLFEFF